MLLRKFRCYLTVNVWLSNHLFQWEFHDVCRLLIRAIQLAVAYCSADNSRSMRIEGLTQHQSMAELPSMGNNTHIFYTYIVGFIYYNRVWITHCAPIHWQAVDTCQQIYILWIFRETWCISLCRAYHSLHWLRWFFIYFQSIYSLITQNLQYLFLCLCLCVYLYIYKKS